MDNNISQADMIVFGQKILANLETDLAEFSGMDSVRFTQGYLQDFRDAIQAALAFVDDETVQDEQTILTEKVENIMKSCRKEYKLLKYFVEKAFGEQKGMMNKFGFDDYGKVSRSQAKMIVFMHKIYTIANENNTELIAEGYSQAQIDNLRDLHQQLSDANLKQDSFKGQRLVTTQERHEHFKKLYEFISQTCKMGKILYEDDNPAKYKQYIIFKTSKSDSEGDNSVDNNPSSGDGGDGGDGGI